MVKFKNRSLNSTQLHLVPTKKKSNKFSYTRKKIYTYIYIEANQSSLHSLSYLYKMTLLKRMGTKHTVIANKQIMT